MSEMDKALKSLRPRFQIVSPEHVRLNGKTRETQIGWNEVIDIPLVFDGKGGYHEDATHYTDYTISTPLDAHVWFFQLMLALCDSLHIMGGSMCRIDPTQNPSLYRRLVALQAKSNKRGSSKMPAEEKKLLKRNVCSTYYFDPGFMQDVKDYEQMLDKVGKKAEAAAKKGAKESSGESASKRRVVRAETFEAFLERTRPRYPGDNSRTHINHAICEETGVALAGPKIDDCDCLHNKLNGSQLELYPGVRRQDDSGYLDLIPNQNEIASKTRAVGVVPVDADVTNADEPSEPREPYTGDRRIEKVTYTLVPIPHVDDPENRFAGMIARFVIRDPAVDVGAFFSIILQNLESRTNILNGNKRSHDGGPGRDLFMHYMDLFSSGHPAGNSTSEELYSRHCVKVNPDLAELHSKGADYRRCFDFTSKSSPTYMPNLFTTERAIAKMLECKGLPDVLGVPSDWIDRANNVVKFNCDAYRYECPQVFWTHKTDVGLAEQYFPFINSEDNFLSKLFSESNLERILSSGDDADGLNAEDRIQNEYSKLKKLLSESTRVNRNEMMKNNLLDYPCDNDFHYRSIEADGIYRKVEKHRPAHALDTLMEVQKMVADYGKEDWADIAQSDDNLWQRVQEYGAFSRLLEKTRRELARVLIALWQWKGDINSLSISDPIKCMLRWHAGNLADLPHMSRPYVAWDPELDMFGNTQLQKLWIFVHFARVLQPMICMLSEGLFSCYEHAMRVLTFNMMIHGRFDVGKTFAAIKTLIDFTCIAGTVMEYSLQTKAADTTRRHEYDVIRASDECPRWITSEKEAERNPELVDKEKIKMTRNQLNLKNFTWVNLPNGEKIRWNENTVTDSKMSSVFVTNAKVESKRALSSRMMRITAKQSNTPANEVVGEMDATLLSDMQRFLHINQYLTTCLKKAAAVGAVTRKPEMWLFKQVANRVLHYLREWGHIGEDVGPRSIEIMLPYARQLVDCMACRMHFDLPFSEAFEKEFCVEDIVGADRYRYSTVSLTVWVLTACATEWINDDNANVMRALILESGCDWSADGENAYDVFTTDLDHTVPWRLHPNTDFEKRHQVAEGGAGGGANGVAGGYDKNDEWLVNLNYLTVNGSLEQISHRVAQHTHPRMSPTDVQSTLEQLKDQLVKVDHNGYALQPKGTFAQWHMFQRLPGTDGPNDEGQKKLGPGCPKRWLRDAEKQNNPLGVIQSMRQEQDVSSMSAGGITKKIPAVDLTEINQRKLHFHANAVQIFNQSVIQRAIVAAITCSTTRIGKYLLGFADIEDASRVSVLTFTEEAREDVIARFDAEMQYQVAADGSLIYTGPMDEDHRPVSRRQGISFNNRAALHKSEGTYVSQTQWAPKKKGDESWKDKYANGVKLMSKTRDIVCDLDYESAARQHLACGLPIEDPVRDPKWLDREYRKWCQTNRKNPDLGMDYPLESIQVRNKLNQTWFESAGGRNISSQIDKAFSAHFSQASRMSRAERERAKRQRRNGPGAPVAMPPQQQQQQQQQGQSSAMSRIQQAAARAGKE